MKRIVALTGAGMSAESGLKTFRDADGLWEGHDVMQVASPEGWRQDPELVLDFYNQRRRQLFDVRPNQGHELLAELEQRYSVDVVTQNVDDLHERAGSSRVLHLHGELLKVRSSLDERLVQDWTTDLVLGDLCELGSQLRPDIVWFGEAVPLLEPAAEITSQADIIIIIGTSMQVYPAASLIHFAQPGIPIFFIDPRPTISESQFSNLTVFADTAVTGMQKLAKLL
jgi:NAD-dependent deacetylase